MKSKDQELEVKFHVLDLSKLENRMRDWDTAVVQPRTHEVNLRFDTPQGELARTERVLRLRQDTAARVTYKGPSLSQEGVRLRQEYEFVVSDHQAARNLFEALGYQVSMMYEKYRTTYDMQGVFVTLDEMPYGRFLEVEGPDPASIRSVSHRLGLDWDARVLESYTLIFDRLRLSLALSFRDLSFANFSSLDVSLDVLGIHPADT
jgi:adenylate cyclase class 2